MDESLWSRVDAYLGDHVGVSDPMLDATLTASVQAGLPEIAVSPPQGKLLMLLAQTVGARRILEIGTLGGYSTIWLARALPDDGELVTCEYSNEHALVARQNLDDAGVGHLVDIRIGPALDTLPSLSGPFDFAFIDADKEHNPDYFRAALDLSRPGSLIVVDNTVRGVRSSTPSAPMRPPREPARCTRLFGTSPASRRRRSRPSAARATTDSCSRASSAEAARQSFTACSV